MAGTARPSGGTFSGLRDQAELLEQQSALKERATEVGQQIKEAAGGVAQQAGEQLQSQIEQRKHEAARGVGKLASVLRNSSMELRKEEKGAIPAYVERAADGLENLSSYMRSKSVRDVIDDVESMARREPAIFLGAAFALGLLGSRFLKSSRGQQNTVTPSRPIVRRP
jgi:hypothetical protein